MDRNGEGLKLDRYTGRPRAAGPPATPGERHAAARAGERRAAARAGERRAAARASMERAAARADVARVRGAAAILAASALALLGAACGSGNSASTAVSGTSTSATSPSMTITTGPAATAPGATTTASRATTPQFPPQRPGWLGLNYNSSARAGRVDDFSKYGVVYDRSGNLQVNVGTTVQNSREFANAIRTSLGAGMIPDIPLDPASGPTGCAGDPNASTLCLPSSAADIRSYVDGFVQTAQSVVRAYPGRKFLFEPMNEPWNWASPPGTLPGRRAANEYAAMLAQLFAAAKAAGIPLSDIYVPATNTLTDGTDWISDLYDAQPCLKPGPATCGPIMGWSTHPYGLPYSPAEGINSLPALRAKMLSGRDRVVVTEIGFCSRDVANGLDCNQNLPDVVGPSGETAQLLRQTLIEARTMHDAGWLEALIVWNRIGDGWSMQNADGSLTAPGAVLQRFAQNQ